MKNRHNIKQSAKSSTRHYKGRHKDGKSRQSRTYSGQLIGQVNHVSPRYAYISVEGIDDCVYIPTCHLKGAFHQDEVAIVISQKPAEHGQEGKQGHVISIVKRSQNKLVGRLEKQGEHFRVIPDHKRLHYPILVDLKHLNSAQPSDKVIVKIVKWPTSQQQAQGKVTQVLGPAGTHDVEMNAIVAQFGFSTEFPAEALQEAQKLPETFTRQTLQQRRDLRQIPTFTIDPEDAKDFDDALSIRKLPDGDYEVGIHIADVSHYVREGTYIDKEALVRATSIYLVDRTISMLPERLANDLCSLKPQQDRLAFSVILNVDKKARMNQCWIGETIIHSDKRFTYATAQQTIDAQSGELCQELTLLHELAQNLRTRRLQDGAIGFENTEVHVQLDKEGQPTHIMPKATYTTNTLVEEWMLMANKQVAEHVHKHKQEQDIPTFLYRTHDTPDVDKLQEFTAFVRQLGHCFKPQEGALAASFNKLNHELQDEPYFSTVQALAIRTMAKAIYTTDAKPHFGLGFTHYTHFTSPIRRYPDLMVHRLVKHYLQKGKPPEAEAYEAKCRHASAMEGLATEAERASLAYIKVLFMQGLQGQKLQGVISGVTEWGLYVEILDNKCEGMVRLADIKDDYYRFDAKRFCVKGTRSGQVYRIGDKVKVTIKACHIDKRSVDFELAT